MLILFMLYISISLILFIKNLCDMLRCSYIKNKLETNEQSNNSSKNLNYTVSVRSLLKRTGLYHLSGSYLSGQQSYKICRRLTEARGIYRHRMIHCMFWPLALTSKMHVFRPIHKGKLNIFIKLTFCLIESLAIYLLGLYLDTTGIGNKILDALLGFLFE